MGVREETLNLLREGLSPKEIAKAKGVSINTTLGYLDQLVGRGDLRRSDIFFSLPEDVRGAISGLANSVRFRLMSEQSLLDILRQAGIRADLEDIRVVIKYGDARHALGDMYEDLRTIETHLHDLIRETLIEEFGEGESEWWRKGIPLSLRQSCQARREEDEDPVDDPYCYIDLLDLWSILDKQWNVLKKLFPESLTANKHTLREQFLRLNWIRRNVMHPIRGLTPSEDDFEFIREFKKQLRLP